MNKKLIEVALPLDEINAACVREKHVHHGHPSTLHLWWARRPLAAARAVTFASLVDDPSSHPNLFPTEADQAKERERLFGIIRDLVVWENSNNEDVLSKAQAEIMKSTDNNPPAFLDPFAGGGALPLEAQRLGLNTYACDLNPVAVMINKAMVEIPAKYQKLPPVNPEHKHDCDSWDRSTGMASDVEYYGKMLKQKAFEKIGHLYPTIRVKEDGKEREATVMAWIWARTVKCPNPACGCEMPLANTFVLCKKNGKEAWVEPKSRDGKVFFNTHNSSCPKDKETIKRGKGASFECISCGTVAEKKYIHDQFENQKVGERLMAIVAEGSSGKIFLSPSERHIKAAEEAIPLNAPTELMDLDSPNLVSGRGYGITRWRELFSNRQLVLAETLIGLLDEIERSVLNQINGKTQYTDYEKAIRVYLTFVIDKLLDHSSSFCSWNINMQAIRNVFGRQAIPMAWDYAEVNPFCNTSGCFDNMLEWVYKSVQSFPVSTSIGQVAQWDATQDNSLRDIMISTDPPYYDNIGYAELSDFFYVWMRKALQKTYPILFSTILTPKTPELVALPHRFDGSKPKAKEFFEDGMSQTCKQLFLYSREDIPVTIYYAFKQTEMDDDDGKASSGWETMLTSIINAGFSITGTWPIRTEMDNRPVAADTNALASSVIIVCRKTKSKLSPITMRQFLDILKSETVPALKQLQAANIAPVDLAQSSIGPGIAVYSRYEAIIKSDGSKLGVREALKLINHELDSHLTASIGSTDSSTSYCLSLYTQKAFNEIPYGDAETLAKAKNIAVADLAKIGVLDSAKSKVNLRVREDLPKFNKFSEDCLWLVTQQIVHAYKEGGYAAVAEIFNEISESTAEKVKSLCYQLFSIAENKGWAQEALVYNEIITTWDSTVATARELKVTKKDSQPELF